ncbi:MAG: hypothetical protein AB7H97_22830 [Pseudobdellovibrionaceae bacterium]
MAKLDRGAVEELKKENQALKEELQKAIEDKKKFKDSATHADADKKNYRKQFDTELNELKLKALREAKDQREEDHRKFEQWKQEAVSRLAAAVNDLGHSKERAWITRPLSKDMMLEWAGDMNDLFREHLLGEKPSVLPKIPETTVPQGTFKGKVPGQTATGIKAPPVGQERRSRNRRKQESVFSRFAIFGVVGLVVLAAAFFFFAPKKRLEGTRVSASQGAAAPVEAPPADDPSRTQLQPPPARVQAQEQTPAPKPVAPARRFEPSQDKIFKKTYTDNVLFTLNYAEAELNMDFRRMWIKDLNKVGKGHWKMDSRTLGSIATNELVLIQDLTRMRNAIGPASDSDRVGQLRVREAQFVKELTRQLGKKSSLDKFMGLKRAFYNRNQVYLSRETR